VNLPKWSPCRAGDDDVAFLVNPKTGRTVPICRRHGQNHFRCCTDPGRFHR
jgi:hypothetical protein